MGEQLAADLPMAVQPVRKHLALANAHNPSEERTGEAGAAEGSAVLQELLRGAITGVLDAAVEQGGQSEERDVIERRSVEKDVEQL